MITWAELGKGGSLEVCEGPWEMGHVRRVGDNGC